MFQTHRSFLEVDNDGNVGLHGSLKILKKAFPSYLGDVWRAEELAGY